MTIELELALLISLAVILYTMPADNPSRTDSTSTWKFPSAPMRESSNALNAPAKRPESPEDMIAPLPVKKPSAAVYPLMAGRTKKPFSRSAQKRQSVQMLGSIEHLQHHFSKIGLTSKKPPPSKLGALPAIGPSSSSPPRSPIAGPVLPPSPAQPAPPSAPAYLLAPPVKIDLEALRAEAVHAIEAVVQLWDLPRQKQSTEASSQPRDILEVLKCTVAAIRAVRTFSLSLPSSAFRQSTGSSGFLAVPTRQSISTTSRPSLSVAAGSRSSNGSTNGDKDPLVDVRKSALEVLVSLRALEEKCRIEGSNRLLDEDSSATASPELGSLASRAETPSKAPAISDPMDDEPLYDEEAEYYDGVNFGAEHQELRKTWEEKLASGEEGWLYRSDVDLATEFNSERANVWSYLETVEDVLFGASDNYVAERLAWAWEDAPDSSDVQNETKFTSRRTSGSERIESWTQGDWEGKELEQLHDMLLANLPLQMQILIPQVSTSGDASAFLTRLADGYLVALAFNAAIERSEKPWGLISGADVHDTLENIPKEGDAKDWTFRRAENLTSLAAAMRHRYNIPIQIPTAAPSDVNPLFLPAQPSSGTIGGRRVSGQRPTAIRDRSSEAERILFDPLQVARRDQGWEDALQRILLPWLAGVLKERQHATP